MIRVFIGYDEREAIAFHVACQSIICNTKTDVQITPLVTDSLRYAGIYNRPADPKASNAFSYTRFMVPYLSGYVGKSIYMDPDVIVLADLRELLAECEDVMTPVWVAKHDYDPKRELKYFGAKQYKYPRKNWSSIMVFENSACQFQLHPENVNQKSPQWLHQFGWVGDRNIGEIPIEWNWLVDEYEHNDNAKLLHYTNGIPPTQHKNQTDHQADWDKYLNMSMRCHI
jgi:lipopolysaccharide biosynthesis glycosyltransferase